MARRRRPEKREILPDPKFGDVVLSKFMNSVMLDGKKSVAEGIVYGALESVETRLKREPLGVFHDALNNVKPGIEVRSRRVGGAPRLQPLPLVGIVPNIWGSRIRRLPTSLRKHAKWPAAIRSNAIATSA